MFSAILDLRKIVIYQNDIWSSENYFIRVRCICRYAEWRKIVCSRSDTFWRL